MRFTMLRTPRSFFMVFTLGAIVGGCRCGGAGPKRPRQPVSGIVTIEWEPMKSGVICFEPVSAGRVAPARVTIVDGRYSIPRAEGLIPGTYKVKIVTTSQQSGRDRDDRPGPFAGPMRLPGTIPSRYNTETILRAEVTDGGDNVFFYDLKTSDREPR